jgi:hypothetical protein
MEELLKLQDMDFVRASYRALLGREPDADGLVNYVDQIRRGVAKEQVIRELVLSPEGSTREFAMTGLLQAVDAAAPADPPGALSRYVVRLLGLQDVARIRSLEKTVRAIENRLHRMHAETVPRTQSDGASQVAHRPDSPATRLADTAGACSANRSMRSSNPGTMPPDVHAIHQSLRASAAAFERIDAER